MNYILFPKEHKKQEKIVEKLNSTLNKLSAQFEKLDTEKLEISEYTKNYFLKYIRFFPFYASHYAQLMLKATNELQKPIEESVFIDYGGGSGFLSLLAKSIGFKKVIYCDIYDVSAKDAQMISKSLNIDIDNFIAGNIENVISFCKEKKIKPDLLCSFDVLEHIYDLENWFTTLSELNNRFSLIFTTGANPYNFLINKSLRKAHYQVEYLGKEEDNAWKKRDNSSAFLNERKKIIKAYHSEFSTETLDFLAKNTRGLIKSDIEKQLDIFLKQKKLSYKPDDKSNTCDPYTGNWEEHLITKKILRKTIDSRHFSVKFQNNYYAYSSDKKLNIFKYALNILIKILPKSILNFSPSYTLICNRITSEI